MILDCNCYFGLGNADCCDNCSWKEIAVGAIVCTILNCSNELWSENDIDWKGDSCAKSHR